jgi:hypothetical protein
MLDNQLNDTICTFDAVEANLLKAEKLLSKINHAIPVGICFGSDPGYERAVSKHIPIRFAHLMP